MSGNFSAIDYLGYSKGVINVNTNDTLPPVKWHYVRQANDLLYGIDKIHFLGESPAVYFKLVTDFQTQTLNELALVQKSIWNQGKVPFLVVESPTEIRIYNGFEPPINPNDPHKTITTLQLFQAAKNDATSVWLWKDFALNCYIKATNLCKHLRDMTWIGKKTN